MGGSVLTKIKLIEDKQSNLEVQIRYPAMNAYVKQLIFKIKSLDIKIIGSDGEKNILLNVDDVFYIECIERKTFIYTQEGVYRSSKKLYQLFDDLKEFGFVQISKSCILNMNELDYVKILFNSRLEATLTNGEKVIITRKYIPVVKDWLDKGGDFHDE